MQHPLRHHGLREGPFHENGSRESATACRSYERLFSRTLPNSDIGRLNRACGAVVPIDPCTADVLTAAMRYCAASESAFDVTVAPLCELWNFREGRIADARSLRTAAAHVNWQALQVWKEDDAWHARLADAEARIDLGGIAKGWIADTLGDLLMASGIEGALVDLGGNVLVRGSKPDGTLWRIALRLPADLRGPDGPQGPGEPPSVFNPQGVPRQQANRRPVIELSEGSVVTSGTYERCFVRDGIRYHHVLDPSTGMPVDTPWASVSVKARSSIDAEGFSTTLLALGLEHSRSLAARHPEIIQAYFLDWNGRLRRLRENG